MASTDRWSGFFWFFFGTFTSYESYRLGLGTVYEPGPGFLFFWTGVVVAILALVVVIKAFRAELEQGQEPLFTKASALKAVFVLLALFLYGAFIEQIGFIIATLMLFLFLLGVVEKKGWLYASLVSVAVTALAYLVFETGLQSQLPKGLLEFLRI